jgi:putative hydrolase of the HAD superfamily
MMKHIKMITFDLDDTLWDNRPTIMKAEIDTRKWIEDKVGEIEWGDFNDFLNLREDLIKEDKTIEWDISKLRKEIFRKKLWHVTPEHFRDEIVDKAFEIFIAKRHEIKLFNGVKESLENLSKKYTLGVLTNGNADVYKFDIGRYFNFSISSLEAKDSKPNRAHFDMAISKVNDISFNNILHIGDHQINDILCAHNLGIDTLWFNNTNQSWSQDFEKPDEFSSWANLEQIIRNKYER